VERRYRLRLRELLADAEVPPGLLRGVMPRLEVFLQPFAASLISPEQRTNARHYVQGLISDLDSKDTESIAYLHNRDRQGLQKFIGQAEWDPRPLLDELVAQVSREGGEADAVLVFDPSAFPKKGNASVGVQRQWCGRLGKIDNCQVGVYLGYVGSKEQTLVDFRLYLPRAWATDRKRRAKAGVPREVRFRTRHELALQMLDERGPQLPHAWVAGDDEMGRCSSFRRELRARSERYLLAVPSNTLVRDLVAGGPPSARGGRRLAPFVRVDQWCTALPDSSWEAVEVRDGAKGPLIVQVARTLVQAKTEGKVSDVAETLVVFRTSQEDGSWKHDYLLSQVVVGVSSQEFARVFQAGHQIEQCLKDCKSEAGLGDSQVRTWEGWHHHQVLSLVATWFLKKEARRGKNPDAGVDASATASADSGCARSAAQGLSGEAGEPYREPPFASQREGPLLPLATT
jgi:SRSO17 transposase